jgi:hypothetical protein
LQLSSVLAAKGKGIEDFLTGFWRELVEKIDDLSGGFFFEPCRISSSGDFGMRTIDVNGNVPRSIELTAYVALYGWHLWLLGFSTDQSELTIPIPYWMGRMGARDGYAFFVMAKRSCNYPTFRSSHDPLLRSG